MADKGYTLDARPTSVNGEHGYWVGIVHVRHADGLRAVYTTEPDYKPHLPALMAQAEREYLTGLEFEANLCEGDTLRSDHYPINL